MEPQSPKSLCIYHGGCPDGFGAAYVVWLKYGDAFEYFPGVYAQPPPDYLGRDVLLVDFSYPLSVMREIITGAASVKIIDHHQTAEETLETLKAEKAQIGIVFDKNHSGAMLAYQHFYPLSAVIADSIEKLERYEKEGIPVTIVPTGEIRTMTEWFLSYIEDRDLWTKKLPQNEEFYVALRSYPQDFEVWNKLTVPQLISEGVHIRRFYNEVKKEIMKNAYDLEIDGYTVPVVNAPWLFASDIAGDLSEGKPFAACYWDTPAGTVFSLRSKETGEDVAKIAEKLGGGGHKHASGFTAKNGIFRSIEKA